MDENVESIYDILKEKIEDESVAEKLSEQLYKGSVKSLEIENDFDSWLNDRFKYQFVWLDKDDYVKALVRALWLSLVYSGQDFGGTRQRDMAQVWTDTARGFLGELAFSRFLKNKFEIETKWDTRRGEIEEFLPSDIAKVKFPGEDWIDPSIKISIKTTKFNGRWLDVPGAQIEHSDAFVLAKIGISRHHFLAFLKAISFLKDKLFVSAKELGELTNGEAIELWDDIPEFDNIPAYITGYIVKSELNLPIHMINARIKGWKPKRIAIDYGIGIFSRTTLRNNADIKSLDPDEELRIDIEPIWEPYTSKKFLCHSGGMKYGQRNWEMLVEQMKGEE